MSNDQSQTELEQAIMASICGIIAERAVPVADVNVFVEAVMGRLAFVLRSRNVLENHQATRCPRIKTGWGN